MTRQDRLPGDPVSVAEARDLGEIYEAHFSYVYRTLLRFGVSASDAEDLAHDVFLVASRRLPEYDGTRPLRPWLFGIAYRRACEERRRVRYHPQADPDAAEPPGEDAMPEERLAADETRRIVLEALGTLEIDQAAVLVAHDIDGYSVPEIASELGISPNTVYSRLRLGRARFASSVRRLRLLRGAGGEE